MIREKINLIPNAVNPSPDYYCTWQTQLYASNDGKPEKQRAVLGEDALFQNEKPFGWTFFYEKARQDLFFVMDDSWDVPLDGNSDYFGSLVLNHEKFPHYTQQKNNAEALAALVNDVKKMGWKGLGGWVCAQEAHAFCDDDGIETYWKDKLTDMRKSGFSYWKVDWGKKRHDFKFRKMLTDLAKQYAPELVIEHALVKKMIPYCDVYRTYDVPALMSIPMTMQKLAELSDIYEVPDAEKHYLGLVNCEDEAYIAAAGGFTMGIMRHPYRGCFVNGLHDMSFPAMHRDLKTKIHEVIRAVRFHRIAPAFSMCDSVMQISPNVLLDTWEFAESCSEIESWWLTNPLVAPYVNKGKLTQIAPASIGRNTMLPEITADESGNVPFCISARNPNGVFSIATLGRTIGRKYYIPRCDVVMNISNADTVGVFGEYRNLFLQTENTGFVKVLMQDLADELAYDVTDQVEITGKMIAIPGELISRVGTMSQPDNDSSEPGVVIRLVLA